MYYLGIQIFLSDHQANRSVFYQNEFWKDVDIEGFRNLYKISSLGRLSNHRRILIQNKVEGRYKTFALRNGKVKNCSYHQLVALHFIPNPENKPEVNHKNGDKWDCRMMNLEWNTRKENTLHSYHVLKNQNLRGIVPLKGKDCPWSKPVFKICPITKQKLKEYETINQAAIDVYVSATGICACLHGKSKTSGGFKWEYK